MIWSRGSRYWVALIVCIGALIGDPHLSSAQAVVQTVPDATGMTNGKVFAMVRVGNTLYVGGQFTDVYDQNHKNPYPATNLAAFDMSTGLGIPSFVPAVTSSSASVAVVRSLAASPDGTMLYVGGTFDSVGGQSVLNLARIDLTTGGTDSTFHPQVGLTSSEVDGILASSDSIYFGGEFTTVNGTARQRLAKVLLDGTLDPVWKPKASNRVRTLIFAPDGNTIFIGGRFQTMNGVARANVARVSPTTGALDPWAIPAGVIEDPQQNFSLVATPTRLYGGFGSKPNYAAAFRLDNGDVGSLVWRYNTVGNVQTVTLDPTGTELFIGGHFGTGRLQQTVCGNLQLHGLALLFAATGTIDCSWVPQLTPFGSNFQGVWSLLLDGSNSHIWAGGRFSTVSGQTQTNVARFSFSP